MTPPPKKEPRIPARVRDLLPRANQLADKLENELNSNPKTEDQVQKLLEAQARTMSNLRTMRKNRINILSAEADMEQEIELINWLILDIAGLKASGPKQS